MSRKRKRDRVYHIFSFEEKKFVLQALGKLPENHLAVFLIKGPLLIIISSSSQLLANELISEFNKRTKSKGGGSPTIAQTSLEDSDSALEIMFNIIEKKAQNL